MNFRLFSDRDMAQKNQSIRTHNSYNQMLYNHQSLERHSRSSQAIMQTNQNISCPNNSIVQNTSLGVQGYQNYPNPSNSNQTTINFMSAHQNCVSVNNSILGTNVKILGHQDYPSLNDCIQGTNIKILGHQDYPSLNDFIQGSYHGNDTIDATTQTMVPLVTYSYDNGYSMLAAQNGALTLLYLPKDPPLNMGSNNNPPSLPSHVGSAGNSSLNNNVSLQGYSGRDNEEIMIDSNEENEDNIDLSLHL